MNKQQIKDELKNTPNSGEVKLCEFQLGMTGSFFKSLFNAMFIADSQNLNKLAKAFPEEAEAVKRFMSEPGYWENLKDRYINMNNG